MGYTVTVTQTYNNISLDDLPPEVVAEAREEYGHTSDRLLFELILREVTLEEFGLEPDEDEVEVF